MNKYKKALNFLTNKADDLCQSMTNKILVINNSKVLQELVDKETPKKLIIKGKFKNCPNCLRRLSSSLNSHLEIKYCPNCGQHLDWGIEDEK